MSASTCDFSPRRPAAVSTKCPASRSFRLLSWHATPLLQFPSRDNRTHIHLGSLSHTDRPIAHADNLRSTAINRRSVFNRGALDVRLRQQLAPPAGRIIPPPTAHATQLTPSLLVVFLQSPAFQPSRFIVSSFRSIRSHFSSSCSPFPAPPCCCSVLGLVSPPPLPYSHQPPYVPFHYSGHPSRYLTSPSLRQTRPSLHARSLVRARQTTYFSLARMS